MISDIFLRAKNIKLFSLTNVIGVFMNNKRNILIILMILVLILSLIPIFSLCSYCFATGDDYGYGAVVRHSWDNSHSIFEIIKTSIIQVRGVYRSWQGTWLSVFLFAINPEIFGFGYYSLTPVIMLILHVIAAWLINLVGGMEFTGIPLIIVMFVLIVLVSFLIPDAVTKWQIGAPVLVPLFMKANMTPDFTQFVFKAADSIGKGLTPFFIYFVVMLAFLEKYNDKETNKITVFGTLKLLMPTILLFAVTWILILVGWFIIGIPIGPDTNPTMLLLRVFFFKFN